MKKHLFISLLVLTACSLSAQINSVHDIKTAQLLALDESKLILIDFWAVWCAPCQEMETQLWNSPEMMEVSDKVIGLKVDIDVNRRLATEYGVRIIPEVKLITATGEVLGEITGFASPHTYLEILEALPDDVSELNKHLVPVIRKEEDANTYFQLGLACQNIGRNIDHLSLQRSFLTLSDKYFGKAHKQSEDPTLTKSVSLYEILNHAYRGNSKKALKKIEKLTDHAQDEAVLELKRFVTAFCYKCEGDQQKFEEVKKHISNREYLTQLEEVVQ